MHLDTRHITSTVRDCWGVTLEQRLNILQARRRFLTVEEYCTQYKETIETFNESIKEEEKSYDKDADLVNFLYEEGMIW